MKKSFLVLLLILLTACNETEKSEAVNSSDFQYSGLLTTSASFGSSGADLGIAGSVGITANNYNDIKLSANDQFNLITPDGQVMKGVNYQQLGLLKSIFLCCTFSAGVHRENLADFDIALADNIWQFEFKRNGILEDSFTLTLAKPIVLDQLDGFLMNDDGSITLSWQQEILGGNIDIRLLSAESCDVSLYFPLSSADKMITIKNEDVIQCKGLNAMVVDFMLGQPPQKKTTDILQVPLAITISQLEQHIELVLKE
ncbi:hypothetical protein CMT41_01840 [Colwellia sp. MT41]|uniref:hypothetical protein n=1 Tax=Colwellia sp. MT41 TaxID=58049 RepID=UPI0007179ADC|nr:hypothetical protein [Colwellia sp. MT41]ALO33594.1 hypothetical protein CMT41_01840 [Colwellia sp. MT41]